MKTTTLIKLQLLIIALTRLVVNLNRHIHNNNANSHPDDSSYNNEIDLVKNKYFAAFSLERIVNSNGNTQGKRNYYYIYIFISTLSCASRKNLLITHMEVSSTFSTKDLLKVHWNKIQSNNPPPPQKNASNNDTDIIAIERKILENKIMEYDIEPFKIAEINQPHNIKLKVEHIDHNKTTTNDPVIQITVENYETSKKQIFIKKYGKDVKSEGNDQKQNKVSLELYEYTAGQNPSQTKYFKSSEIIEILKICGFKIENYIQYIDFDAVSTDEKEKLVYNITNSKLISESEKSIHKSTEKLKNKKSSLLRDKTHVVDNTNDEKDGQVLMNNEIGTSSEYITDEQAKSNEEKYLKNTQKEEKEEEEVKEESSEKEEGEKEDVEKKEEYGDGESGSRIEEVETNIKNEGKEEKEEEQGIKQEESNNPIYKKKSTIIEDDNKSVSSQDEQETSIINPIEDKKENIVSDTVMTTTPQKTQANKNNTNKTKIITALSLIGVIVLTAFALVIKYKFMNNKKENDRVVNLEGIRRLR